jgi:apolipoprotein N-acyltransferase
MKKTLFAAIAGALSVAAYAPLEWWWLMPICIASLYFLMQGVTPKHAFYIAFAFGLAQFGIGASWVYVSLTTYGNMPMLMAATGVLLFVSALAFFTGLIGYVFNRLTTSKNVYLNAFIFSALWVITEWLRSVVLTGFPWLDVGYSQTTQWLSGYAAIGSVYLVSFSCVCVSALLLIAIQDRKMPALLSVFAIIAVGVALKNIEWSEASKKSHDILLVQGNVPIQEKWKPSYKGILLSSYFSQMQQHSADLVILPETALPIYLDQTDPDFWKEIRGSNKAILAGIVERDFDANQLFNSAVLSCNVSPGSVSKNEDKLQIYRKQHLVPFGEYLPLRKYFSWILDYLQLPMSDFSSGSKEQIVSGDGMNINLSMC